MTETDTESLIGDEAWAAIGTVLREATGTVVQRDFQRWAAAVGDRNPLYFDAEYARVNGYRDVVMPPMYLSHVTAGVVHLDELRPDGIPLASGGMGNVRLPRCPRRMAGGDTFTFIEAIYAGDVVTSVRKLVSLEQKMGRSGPFVLLGFQTTYTRSDGVLLATMDASLIARPANN